MLRVAGSFSHRGRRLADLTSANTILRGEVQALTAALAEARRAAAAALDQREQASHLRGAFLSNMSHEIRTPMTSVLGFAELLSLGEVPPERRQNYVEKILRNSRHLLALIDNLIDLSKIEAGFLVPHCLSFSLAKELAMSLDMVRDQADAKGLSLKLECLAPFPAAMLNDQMRCRQILFNLIGNAVKFTTHGTVEVVARAEAAAEAGQEAKDVVRVDVIDTGLGISPERQKDLFTPFSQLRLDGPKTGPGQGLNLVLARHIARALGGDLVLTASREGQGSTFTLTLPLNFRVKPEAKPAHG